DSAAGYQLYRQAPGATELSAYQRLPLSTEFVDATTSDGLYRYAIASVRQANNQESLSAQSNAAQATADALAPGAPTSLALLLNGSGIFATWQAPAGGAVASYNLY